MRIRINDTDVVIPSSLSEFTLGQRIAFQEEYGNDLDVWVKRILEMPDGIEKELETTEFQFEKMFRSFAFFAGTTSEALKESEFIDDIAAIYYSWLACLFESEAEVQIQQEYIWKGETWVLHPPALKHGDKMAFGEFIDAKQMIKDLSDLGAGHWEKMLRLCAIYLRKTGEEYQESFLYEGSERLELMKQLPLDIAMGVGFFLTSSMNLCIHHFQSFSPTEQKAAADSLRSILKGGDGSISLRQ